MASIKNGQGKYFSPFTFTTKEDEFRDDKLNSYGKIAFMSDEVHEGEFKNGKLSD